MFVSCRPVFAILSIFVFISTIIKPIVNGYTCASIGYTQLWTCGTCSSSTQFTTSSGNSQFGTKFTGCSSTCYSAYGSGTSGIIYQYQSTLGWSGIAVMYDANPNLVSSTTPCYVQVSYNGGSSWSTVGTHSGTSSITNQVRYISTSADNNANFRVRWMISSAATGGYCNFDTSSICASSVITSNPTPQPTNNPTPRPTSQPSDQPTDRPTSNPTPQPTKQPTDQPTKQPSVQPTDQPTGRPTTQPTDNPTNNPTKQPTAQPTNNPTSQPTLQPTLNPTSQPTDNPTTQPTSNPTDIPSKAPTNNPSFNPSSSPSKDPSKSPTKYPTTSPTGYPSFSPSITPTMPPTFRDGNQVTEAKTTETNQEITTDSPSSGNGDGFSNMLHHNFGDLWYITAIVIGLAVLLCCCCFLIICIKIKRKKKNVAEQNAKQIEMEGNGTNATGNTGMMRVQSLSHQLEPITPTPTPLTPTPVTPMFGSGSGSGGVMAAMGMNEMMPMHQQSNTLQYNLSAAPMVYNNNIAAPDILPLPPSPMVNPMIGVATNGHDDNDNDNDQLIKMCQDCSMTNPGKYDNDGTFYCNSCWISFAETNEDDDGESDTDDELFFKNDKDDALYKRGNSVNTPM